MEISRILLKKTGVLLYNIIKTGVDVDILTRFYYTIGGIGVIQCMN